MKQLHPDRWAKDFYFEAELFDNAPSTATIVTKSLTNTDITNGDYSQGFDTYVTTNNEALEYRFTPRDNSILTTPLNNDYTLYVRVKLLSSTGSIVVELNTSDNSQSFKTNLDCLGSSWEWYKICSSAPIFERV